MRARAQSPRYNDGSKSQKYICFARKQTRYMLGDKTGASYVVGYGLNFPQRPADRGASCPAPPENCTTVNGLYNPAPNPHVLTGALVMVRAHCPPRDQSFDHERARRCVPAGKLDRCLPSTAAMRRAAGHTQQAHLTNAQPVHGRSALQPWQAHVYSPASTALTGRGLGLQDPRTWDYFEDNRASNDTWVSVELNAGFTSVMAGMNQARAALRPWSHHSTGQCGACRHPLQCPHQ